MFSEGGREGPTNPKRGGQRGAAEFKQGGRGVADRREYKRAPITEGGGKVCHGDITSFNRSG